MATPHKGRAKKNRACGTCKPYIAEGNGGKRMDRKAGAYAKPSKHRTDIFICTGWSVA